MPDAAGPARADLARARAAWPALEVPEEAFAAWLADRAGDAPLHVEDLYLACACARGDAKALRAFDETFADEFATLRRRFSYLPQGADDVRQIVHEKLFVGERPRIADYSGRGELRSWLRVAILRVLLNATTRETREVPIADELFLAVPEPTDPESIHLRRAHAEAFKASFDDAVEQLDARSKNILRYALVDRLGIDAIASLYAIHRATAARWVGAAKDELGAKLREALKARLRVSDSDLVSIVRSLQSQLDMTLSGYFGASSEASNRGDTGDASASGSASDTSDT